MIWKERKIEHGKRNQEFRMSFAILSRMVRLSLIETLIFEQIFERTEGVCWGEGLPGNAQVPQG